MNTQIECVGGWVGILSGILQLAGYAIYNYHLHKSENSSNAASWAIWTFGSIINFFLYQDLSEDWAKEVLPFLCSIGCIATFIHIWKRNGIGSLERLDYWILGIDCAIVIYWFITSKDEASLIYQASTVISFVPMIRGLILKEDYERWEAWAIWTIAYETMMFAIVFRWEKWEDIVYPAVCFILHLAVCLIACLTPPARKSG